jgi:hypothetical protein
VPGPAPAPAPPGTGPNDSQFYDSAAAWLGGMTNPFFRTVRRVRKTRLTRVIEAEARVGLKALGQWWTTGRETMTAAEQAAVENVGKVSGYALEAFPWASRLATGFIGGIVASVIFPDSIDESGQFPLDMKTLASGPFSLQVRRMVAADQFTRSRRVPSAAVRELMSRGPDVLLGERPPTLVEKLNRLSDETADFIRGRGFGPGGFNQFRTVPGASVVTATAPGFNDYTPPAPIPRLEVPFDPNAGPPAPSSSSSTSSPSRAGKGGRLPSTPLNWPKIGLFTGATIGGIYLLRQLVGGNPYAGGSVAPVLNAPQPTIVTPPATSVSPGIGPFALGGYGGSVADCGCGPRGPRRKCLERAPVAWRSGRNKGKAAGSKCVRYAQRKS